MENLKGIYCMGTEEETEEILDFANMVFSMSYSSIDFSALLPKAYSRERRRCLRHHLIKEGRKIRALADIYPVTLKLDNSELKAAYIGTVSVHPNTRKKGYMTELMKRAEEDAQNLGCALMILDGDRHRYQHYGFERAGMKYVFCVELCNIRHCCASLYDSSYMESPAYSFEEIDEEGPYLDKMFELYGRRIVTARTREDFLLCLQSSRAATYAVLRKGNIAGYINMSEDEKNVLEFEVDKNSELPRIIYDLMMGLDIAELGFAVGTDEGQKIAYLEKMCDYYNVSSSHQIKILDYKRVLEFLLAWKQKYGMPAISDYVVGIENQDKNSIQKYRISVQNDTQNNIIEVSQTDKKPDAVLGELDFVRLLITAGFYADQQRGAGSRIKNAPAGWFPLPFYLPDADAF